MRHQHRNRHVLEQLAADAAEQGFAQLRVMVAAADDQVGAEIGGAREQNVGDGEATAQRLLEPGRDPMVVQVMDHPVERRAVLLEIALMDPTKTTVASGSVNNGSASCSARVASRVPSQAIRTHLPTVSKAPA